MYIVAQTTIANLYGIFMLKTLCEITGMYIVYDKTEKLKNE